MSAGKEAVSAEAVMEAMLKLNDIRQTLAANPDQSKIDVAGLVSQIVAILQETILRQTGVEAAGQAGSDTEIPVKVETSDILLPEDPALLMKTCDEVRLHLLAVAMLRRPLGDGKRRRSITMTDASGDPKQLVCGPIVREEGGLIYARANGSLVMLLPGIKSAGQMDDLCNQLLKIFDTYGCRYDWLLDFSAVSHPMAPVFVGNLMAYRKALGEAGRSLSLCWVRPTVLAGDFTARLTKIFDLKETGGHLFSAEILSHE